MKTLKLLPFLFVVFLLNTCANQRLTTLDPDSDKAIKSEQQQSASTEKKTDLALNPALSALLASAQKHVSVEDFNGAAASLERALRISPREALVHLRLAEVRLKQGQAHAALQLAFKGQSLMETNSAAERKNILEKQFWQVIGDCYRYLGNHQKAEQAYQNL